MSNIRTPLKGKQLQQLKRLLLEQTGRKRTGAQLAVKMAAQKRKTQKQRAQKAVSKQNITDVVQKVADAVKQQVNDVVPKAVQKQTQQKIRDMVVLPPSLQSVLKTLKQQNNRQHAQVIRKVFESIAKKK